MAQRAAALEVLAVNTYTDILKEIARAPGVLPPAISTFVTTAKSHHEVHLAAWNKALQSIGMPEVSRAAGLSEGLGCVECGDDASRIALRLEQIVAHTYLSAVVTLTNREAITLAAQMQVVDQQHQAFLLFALGMNPVPETFQRAELASIVNG